jgi:succinate dehydrogenase hydrophobic anchor subunit
MFLMLGGGGGAHLLQSCLHAMQDGLPSVVREMHPSFKSLTITNALSLYVYLMDVHHETSLRSILEDDSISSTSRACICSCLGKGERLWLIVRPSICLFHIAHSIFILVLPFHLGLIKFLTSNFFMCECGHGLDAFDTHLICCSFGGQRIATHNAI